MNENRKRIGILVPSSNTIMENDFHNHLSKQYYTVHTARMYLEEATPKAEKQMIEEFARPAAEQLKTLHPDLLVFGCTSAGSLFGPEYDQKITKSLGEITGCDALGVFSCAIEALNKRNAKSIAVLTPYNDALNKTTQKSLEQSGFNVVGNNGMGIEANFKVAQVSPEGIIQYAKEKLAGVKAEALFIPCTNFRALEVQRRLEEELSIPVVTSNSSVLEEINRYFYRIS